MIEKLLAIAKGFHHRFPDGEGPYQMMTRLLEECGELAQQVNHFENSGVKREKYGETDPKKLAKEIMQVMGCAASVAIYYGVEEELEAAMELTYQRLKAEGHIQEGGTPL